MKSPQRSGREAYQNTKAYLERCKGNVEEVVKSLKSAFNNEHPYSVGGMRAIKEWEQSDKVERRLR